MFSVMNARGRKGRGCQGKSSTRHTQAKQYGAEPVSQLDLDEVRLEPVLYVVEASSLLAEVVLLP